MATPDSPQANGLLCWLRCDEASGDLFDSSRRRQHAAAQGNIAYQQPGIPTLGNGYGIAPTSAGPIAIVPTSYSIHWSSLLCPAVSVQAWFKASAVDFASMWGTKHALAYKSSANGDTAGWYLGVLPGGGNTISFRVMDAATSTYTASYTETDFSQFHHYVGTFDTVNVKLYRDGVLVATTLVSGTLGHDPSHLVTIGEGIEGTLDDIAVWNRGLSATEVLRLYGDTAVWKTVQKIRADVFYPYGNGTLPAEQLHPGSITVGPFDVATTVYSGTEEGTDPLTAPNDQWVVNGANWTVPPWVNTSTPHVIAAGTVLATLTPGQTMLLQLRQKYQYDACYGYGSLVVKKAGVAGEGLNIILPEGPSTDGRDETSIVHEGTLFDTVMNDGLIIPIDPTPVPMPDMQVLGDFGNTMSVDSDAILPSGTGQDFNLFENIPIDPLPVVLSVTVNASKLVTFTGEAGWTNLNFVDLYYEVEVSTGMLVIPVSATWEPFSLPTRQQFVTTYQIPPCIGLNWRRVRFVAEANGPGAQEQALRYYSPWVDLESVDFDNPCPGPLDPKLPRQLWITPPDHTPALAKTATSVLDAIATALSGWAAGHWEVDQQTATYITVRRKGGTEPFRAMIFAGTPAQSALAGGNAAIVPVTADALYLGVCEDAGSTPPGDPAMGAPWATTWSGGVGLGSGFSAVSGVISVLLCSCDRMLAMCIYGSNGWVFGAFGEILARPQIPAVGRWGCITSGLSIVDPATGMNEILGAALPMTQGQPCFGTYFDGGQKRLVRGVAVAPTPSAPLKSGTWGYMVPIVMETGDMLGSDRELAGTLRQIRIGPYGAGRRYVHDLTDTPRAIRLNGGSGIVGSGLYLDMDA